MSTGKTAIRSATEGDVPTIAEIYNFYVSNTVVTFEEAPMSFEQMRVRIADVQVAYPWLVFQEGDLVIGYAYAHQMHTRRAYRFSVETSVYLAPDAVGRGIGSLIYRELLSEVKHGGYHSAIGAIALPNERSIRLHEKFGFKKTGHHREVGWKFEHWVDVGYWQLML